MFSVGAESDLIKPEPLERIKMNSEKGTKHIYVCKNLENT